MSVADMTYDVFVRELLEGLRPLWPTASNLAFAFSGDDNGCTDAAIVHGDRAEYLSSLGQAMAEVWGVDPTHYELEYTIVKHEPLLQHAAYVRNLNRWMNTKTLPRKRAARADFVLVAVCWLYGWGGEGSDVVREGLRARFGIEDSAAADPIGMASALYLLSAEAYGNSRKARRTA